MGVCLPVLPAIVSSTLVSTLSSSRMDSSTVSTLGSFNLTRASNSYNSSSVSVWSLGKFPVPKTHRDELRHHHYHHKIADRQDDL